MKVIVLQPQTVKCAMNAYKQELIFITPVSCQLSPLEQQTDNSYMCMTKTASFMPWKTGLSKYLCFS